MISERSTADSRRLEFKRLEVKYLVDRSRRPVGVISVRDIVNYLADRFPHKVLNVPPRPGGNIAPSREGA